MRKIISGILFVLLFSVAGRSAATTLPKEKVYEWRMELYTKTEAATQVPWYYLAAIDQYERSIRHVRKDLPKPEGLLGFSPMPPLWSGVSNPNHDDKEAITIGLFGGLGQDGNGDGKADREDNEDLMHTLASYISQFGMDDNRFRIAIWEYYKRDKTVGAIMTNAKIYRKFGRIDLDEKAFPIPRPHNYTYKNTWGDRRGWGGRRIHEGTDIFASYGTPVRAATYGVVELKGWNKYGGWRVGIRDLNNTYHYYAHLNGVSKDLKVGDVVEPGMVIGSVGSSGYGPPGTSGKFPPHLHFGMYKDNGLNEWSFDPYPHLKAWEREERQKKKK